MKNVTKPSGDLATRWRGMGLSSKLQLWGMATPYLLGTLLLVVLPALITVGISFTKYSAVGIPEWSGLDNFRRLLQSTYVRAALKNTLLFVGMAVPVRLLVAFCLALLLQENKRLFGLHRAAVYLPTVIPEVAYSLIWLWIFNPIYGPLNLLLGKFGIAPIDWLADPLNAQLAIVIMLAFQVGEGFVVILAGLQSIPRSYYEVAKVDGASSWYSFARITLPLIMPWLLLLTFRDILMSLQSTFTPSFVMTYGGPHFATTYLPLLLYEVAFDFFDFGMGAALLVMTYFFTGLIILGIISVSGLGEDGYEI